MRIICRGGLTLRMCPWLCPWALALAFASATNQECCEARCLSCPVRPSRGLKGVLGAALSTAPVARTWFIGLYCGATLSFPGRTNGKFASAVRRVRWLKHGVNVSHLLGMEDNAFEEPAKALGRPPSVHWPLVSSPNACCESQDANGKLSRNLHRPVPVLPTSLD